MGDASCGTGPRGAGGRRQQKCLGNHSPEPSEEPRPKTRARFDHAPRPHLRRFRVPEDGTRRLPVNRPTQARALLGPRSDRDAGTGRRSTGGRRLGARARCSTSAPLVRSYDRGFRRSDSQRSEHTATNLWGKKPKQKFMTDPFA